MITLDEQIEWVQAAINAPLLEAMKDPLSAILATLRSVKQAEPVAWKVEQGARTFYVSPEEFTRLSIDNGSMEPLYAAPAPAPDGWVLVPKEPTDQMLAVWLEPEERNNSTMYFWSRALRRYGNMLAVAPAAPQSGWVSVEERLPTDTKTVLTNSNAEGIKLGMYCEGYWWSGNEEFPMTEVTHWMPLPAAPGRQG